MIEYRFKEAENDEEIFSFIAVDRDRTVGYIVFLKDYNEYYNTNAKGVYYIDKVKVQKEYRCRGIGKTLVKKVIDYAAKNKSIVYLISKPSEDSTIGFNELKKFYEKLGFRFIETIKYEYTMVNTLGYKCELSGKQKQHLEQFFQTLIKKSHLLKVAF